MHYSRAAAIGDIVLMTVFGVLIAGAVGYWSFKHQSMLHEIMDCMPDSSRAAYDSCYEEFQRERE